MIEAWKLGHRPWLYAIVRRIELCRWAFRDKQFYPSARWYARLQALWIILWGHETEICAYCGGGVNAVWWCPNGELWKMLTGEKDGGGVCCMRCFEWQARKQNIFLKWSVTADDYQNWRITLEKETLKQERALPSEKEAKQIEAGARRGSTGQKVCATCGREIKSMAWSKIIGSEWKAFHQGCKP